MYEFDISQGWDRPAHVSGDAVVVMPVASTPRPGQAYEMLCALASQLTAQGRDVVIVDGTEQEASPTRSGDGSHLGLIHALQDPSISGLCASSPDEEWLVMPSAVGLKALLQTARAGGAALAVSRLLAPFAPGAVVLLYAPAATLSALLAGLQVHAMVPVLATPQCTIDSYGSVKLLHAAGLTPVLAAMPPADASSQGAEELALRCVSDCVERYLAYDIQQWPRENWGDCVREAAFAAPWPPGTQIDQPSEAADQQHGHIGVPPTQ